MVENFKHLLESSEIKVATENEKVFEKIFIPFKDEKLKDVGLEIIVRTSYKMGNTSNEVIMQLGEDWEILECIHVVIGKIAMSESGELLYDKTSQDIGSMAQLTLAPEEHFFALKSFMQHVLERGIQESIIDVLKLEEDVQYNFGFNHLMAAQFIEILFELVPNESKELFLFLLDNYYSKFPKNFIIYFEDNPKLTNLLETMKLSPNTIDALATDNLPKIRSSMARRDDLSPSTVKKLTLDNYYMVKKILLQKKDLPNDILKIFSEDIDWQVRLDLASYKPLPVEIVKHLASDENWQVRWEIARREDLPPDVITRLSNDEREEVRVNLKKHTL